MVEGGLDIEVTRANSQHVVWDSLSNIGGNEGIGPHAGCSEVFAGRFHELGLDRVGGSGGAELMDKVGCGAGNHGGGHAGVTQFDEGADGGGQNRAARAAAATRKKVANRNALREGEENIVNPIFGS